MWPKRNDKKYPVNVSQIGNVNYVVLETRNIDIRNLNCVWRKIFVGMCYTHRFACKGLNEIVLNIVDPWGCAD